MYAPRQIRCVVIEVPADQTGRSRIRPSQLLPWSDPTIAGLVSKLQDEVRRETGTSETRKSEVHRGQVSELELPWDDSFEYETGDDFEGFSIDVDKLFQ